MLSSLHFDVTLLKKIPLPMYSMSFTPWTTLFNISGEGLLNFAFIFQVQSVGRSSRCGRRFGSTLCGEGWEAGAPWIVAHLNPDIRDMDIRNYCMQQSAVFICHALSHEYSAFNETKNTRFETIAVTANRIGLLTV